MADYNELIQKLHDLADVIEKNESIHCISTCRQAAYTINKLNIENEMYMVQLNKTDFTIWERIQMLIGSIMLKYYKIRKRWK